MSPSARSSGSARSRCPATGDRSSTATAGSWPSPSSRRPSWANPHLVTDPLREAEPAGAGARSELAACRPSCPPPPRSSTWPARSTTPPRRRARTLKLDGVFTLQEPKRFFCRTEIWPPRCSAPSGPTTSGLSGLEQQYDKVLSGRSGKLIEEHDPAGSQIAGGLHEYQPPARGQDLVLTIDQSLQYETEQACRTRSSPPRPRGAWPC